MGGFFLAPSIQSDPPLVNFLKIRLYVQTLPPTSLCWNLSFSRLLSVEVTEYTPLCFNAYPGASRLLPLSFFFCRQFLVSEPGVSMSKKNPFSSFSHSFCQMNTYPSPFWSSFSSFMALFPCSKTESLFSDIL